MRVRNYVKGRATNCEVTQCTDIDSLPHAEAILVLPSSTAVTTTQRIQHQKCVKSNTLQFQWQEFTAFRRRHTKHTTKFPLMGVETAPSDFSLMVDGATSHRILGVDLHRLCAFRWHFHSKTQRFQTYFRPILGFATMSAIKFKTDLEKGVLLRCGDGVCVCTVPPSSTHSPLFHRRCYVKCSNFEKRHWVRSSDDDWTFYW